ncbi:hypothetical protein VTN96DRAFT_8380 [Rasamsonia emersonii]
MENKRKSFENSSTERNAAFYQLQGYMLAVNRPIRQSRRILQRLLISSREEWHLTDFYIRLEIGDRFFIIVEMNYPGYRACSHTSRNCARRFHQRPWLGEGVDPEAKKAYVALTNFKNNTLKRKKSNFHGKYALEVHRFGFEIGGNPASRRYARLVVQQAR